MRIFLTGQCTLHPGRMEFGNIGNYYIVEPLVRELHRVFPGAEIRTTLQMSDGFCRRERVTCVPMEHYYAWGPDERARAEDEVALAERFADGGSPTGSTGYVDEVLAADLVVDFSGDIWGENADFLGPDRFRVGLYKDLVAQRLGRPTAMIAGSPGPFPAADADLARETFSGFDVVTNREPVSRSVLRDAGFRTDHVVDLACPAFLFEPSRGAAAEALADAEGLAPGGAPVVGFVVCGWNFAEGPFDRWPRDDDEYEPFARAVEHLAGERGARVVLLSHSNGFELPAPPFRLIHGRDYPIAKQLQRVVARRGRAHDVRALDGIYSAWDTKALLGRFDMVVSGRIHAAVGALSQHVPTVVLDYGHPPKAHKLRGFARVAGVEEFVADPGDPADMVARIDACWEARDRVRGELTERMPAVRAAARRNAEILAGLVEG